MKGRCQETQGVQEGSLRTGHLCLEKRTHMAEGDWNRWHQKEGKGQFFKAHSGIWNVFWG